MEKKYVVKIGDKYIGESKEIGVLEGKEIVKIYGFEVVDSVSEALVFNEYAVDNVLKFYDNDGYRKVYGEVKKIECSFVEWY